MEIKSAVFVKSSSILSECPPGKIPEFAFIGRSNVGKSSLINMLTGIKGLAKISSSPGKTRLINHFLINNTWFLVDLPGYGYARVSLSKRAEFEAMIRKYIMNRENLFCLFVLVDGRLDPQIKDIEFINWCGNLGVPIAIVYTKTDKLSMRAFDQNRKKMEASLLGNWEELPPSFSTSVIHKTGKHDILDFIETALG